MTQHNEGIVKHILDLHDTIGTPSHIVTYTEEKQTNSDGDITSIQNVPHNLWFSIKPNGRMFLSEPQK